MDIKKRCDQEKRILAEMIGMYCRAQHGMAKKELCGECRVLLEYAGERMRRCPFGDDKPFCSNCRIHCYEHRLRNQIIQVMRYSGPRMLWTHPVLALRHLAET